MDIRTLSNDEIQKHVDDLEERERRAVERNLDFELDALIGVKLLPCEKDAMRELARTNRPLFDKAIATRPTLRVFGPSPITAEPTQENSSAMEPSGDDLALAAAELAAANTKGADE